MASKQIQALEAETGPLTQRRWIRPAVVEWVRDADRKMMSTGAVRGEVRRTRNSARHHAQDLIDKMVALGLHDRDELVEHTARKDGGWIWHVEYIGRRHGSS
jgi:hypothetical protein